MVPLWQGLVITGPGQKSGWKRWRESATSERQGEAESAWKGYCAQIQLQKSWSQVLAGKSNIKGRHAPSCLESQWEIHSITWALSVSIYQISP